MRGAFGTIDAGTKPRLSQALVAVCFLALAGPRVFAAERVLSAIADTTLFATTPGNNLGRSEMLAVGATGKGFPARTLLRFDLASVVEDPATVVAARLEFSVVRAPAGDDESGLRVHRMLTDWVEGRGTGTLGEPATAGEPTWSHRIHGSAAWAEPGGAPGVDFVAEASGTTAISGSGRYVVEGPELLADIRGWLAQAVSNRGWILVGDHESTKLTARRIGSRESKVPSEAPTLTLTIADVVRPRIDRWEVKDGRFEFGFLAEAGNIYAVQFRPLAGELSGTWTTLTNIVAKLANVDAVVSDPLRPGFGRMYRVADVGDVD